MKKKILIIDDSALMRRVISDIIKGDERFEEANWAGDGQDALELMKENASRYDALILDINMPNMDGFEFLTELNRLKIKARILVVSNMATEGAAETIRALELGAFDFVTKPNTFTQVRSEEFQYQLIRGLEAATYEFPVTEKSVTALSIKRKSTAMPKRVFGEKKLVAIACSTGGPKALQSIIPYLPADLNASVLIVQHMPDKFTNSLAVRLNELSPALVKEAEDKELLSPSTVYIARGGRQMRLGKNKRNQHILLVTEEEARNSLKPCADIMYESLAGSDFDEIICVVLTGMGNDGTEGIRYLNDRNHIKVIAQDAKTSVVYGMPKEIYLTGLVDQVLPLEEIAGTIIKYVGRK